MGTDILKYILILTLLALGAGAVLSWPSGKSKRYDERQLAERGRAAQLAMSTGIFYLIFTYGGIELNLLPWENLMHLTLFGLVLVEMVFTAWCVFRDAYLGTEQNGMLETMASCGLGLLWFLMAWANWDRGPTVALIDLFLGCSYVSTGLFLLIRAAFLWVTSRMENEE